MNMQDLRMNEINQYHNIIRDFSNQSANIKKLSITIYIAFLSVYFGFTGKSPVVPDIVFWIVGLAIPVFCYFYEIYIDFTRQNLRVKMNRVCRKYEANAGIKCRKPKKLRIKILFFSLGRDPRIEFFFIWRRKKYDILRDKSYYVDIFHIMYVIYLFETIITILTGIFVIGG